MGCEAEQGCMNAETNQIEALVSCGLLISGFLSRMRIVETEMILFRMMRCIEVQNRKVHTYVIQCRL